MGIINATPDSFSDGMGYYNRVDSFKKAEEMIIQGVDIIDIGGESTRPGAKEVTENEEQERVIPLIKAIKEKSPQIKISVDTTKFNVAKASLEAGASIINDVSGLNYDRKLANLASEYNAGLVIMHMQGTPRTMQSNPQYYDVVEEVYHFLQERINFALKAGVKEIYADVGIGFGKTLEHNLTLLKQYDKFADLGVPNLLGISRKSFIGKISGIEKAADRDIPTALIHALLLTKKIDIIRVHNVEMINLLKKIYNSLNS